MSFRKLCYINFKYNIKKSLAFFISAIFSCSVLFTYSYFLFNETVGTGISEMGRDSEFLKYVMLTVLIIVVIFALFFINYSYTSYMQSKNREFALYLTFGMGRKDIARISVFETTIIMILTFIMSFIVQYLISKPFLLIARKVLGYQDLAYEMPLVSTFINIITFIVIYISLLLSSYFKLYKLHIIQLFTLTNAQDICNKPKNIIIGPVLIVGALALNSVSSVPMFFLISVLICMFGVYLTISCMDTLIIALINKYKETAYRHLISLKELLYKVGQYKKILFISTVLSIFIIYFVGMSYAFFKQSSRDIDITQPYDLVLIWDLNNDKEVNSNIKDLTTKLDVHLQEEKSIEFLKLHVAESIDVSDPALLISETGYNLISEEKVSVESNNYITITQRKKPEMYPWYSGPIEFESYNDSYQLDFQKEIWDIVINTSPLLSRFFVVSDSTYETMRIDAKENSASSCVMYSYESIMDDSTSQFIEEISRLDNVDAISKELSLKNETSRNSFILFLFCFIGSLFLVSIGFVMYFKVITDIDHVKERFRKIKLVGIESKKIKKMVTFELKLLFYIPVIIGSVIGVLYVVSQTNRTGEYNSMILVYTFSVVITYIILQIFFYLMARHKYFSRI